MALTYNQLVSEVPVLLMAQNRTLAQNMGTVIRQAEDEIIQRLDHDAFRTVISPSFAVDPVNVTVDLNNQPSPVLEVRAMRLDLGGQQVTLERREIERLRMTFGPDDQGVPRFYAEDDAPLVYRVFPTPDTTYQLDVTANVEPDRLSVAVQETLLTRRWPRLTEMAVLKYGARFMRNQTDEARFEKAMGEALAEALLQINRRRRDETGTKPQTTANVTG